MKIIIDTHIFLWALSDPARISKSKRSALESLSNTIYEYPSVYVILAKLVLAKAGSGDPDFCLAAYPWIPGLSQE